MSRTDFAAQVICNGRRAEPQDVCPLALFVWFQEEGEAHHPEDVCPFALFVWFERYVLRTRQGCAKHSDRPIEMTSIPLTAQEGDTSS